MFHPTLPKLPSWFLVNNSFRFLLHYACTLRHAGKVEVFNTRTTQTPCPPYRLEDLYFQLELPTGVNAKGAMFARIQSGHSAIEYARTVRFNTALHSLFFVIVDYRLGNPKLCEPLANFPAHVTSQQICKSSNFKWLPEILSYCCQKWRTLNAPLLNWRASFWSIIQFPSSLCMHDMPSWESRSPPAVNTESQQLLRSANHTV
ncbi:hypothetical protein CDAR_211391 [Caerostris darwini]|uniref:F-box domain-containing protein n=1 Tax=Caerostris darwini TaxID=1538125 RepID=A0AAV4W120_9ARAC|nr:hypothetical protein CDAR_211391 [Caerostris darwini]